MSRAYSWLVLLLFVPLLAPSGAAQTGVSVTLIRLLDDSGQELRIAPVDEFVTVELTVRNGGNAEVPGPLTLRITIRSPSGDETQQELSKSESLPAGAETTFTYSWSPVGRETGDHRFSGQMITPPSSTALVATYGVADNGVPAGTVAERVMSFYWFFVPFIFAIILFFAVVIARRG